MVAFAGAHKPSERCSAMNRSMQAHKPSDRWLRHESILARPKSQPPNPKFLPPHERTRDFEIKYSTRQS